LKDRLLRSLSLRRSSLPPGKRVSDDDGPDDGRVIIGVTMTEATTGRSTVTMAEKLLPQHEQIGEVLSSGRPHPHQRTDLDVSRASWNWMRSATMVSDIPSYVPLRKEYGRDDNILIVFLHKEAH